MSDRLDRGLAAAFGPHSGSDSVLEQLGLRGPSLILEADDGGRDTTTPLAAETLLGTSAEGRYEVDGEIARGGVGVILRGRDLELGRDVAVKVLRPELATRQDVLWRFVEEAQIGGQLQHPGITPVYDLGLLADQRPYFAMKLVRGETLADLLEARPTPTTELGRHLRIFEQVSQTVGYAHARGVVHRDLKPANIMVGAFGEVQVMDWGFAKVLAHGGVADERAPLLDETSIHTVRTDSGGSASQLGSVMGTPSYMPPEQAKGQLDRVDERSDVFGLGAILLEILTGAPPYPVARDTLIRAARGDLGDALARLGEAAVHPRLAALCTACLAVDPNARPRDAGEVAETVGQHLADLEASARAKEGEAAAAAVRARGARRARRLTLGIAAAALLAVLLAGGAYVWVRSERAADRQRAREVLARALAAIDQGIGEAQAIEAQGLDGWDERVAAYERAREKVREAKRLVPAAALGWSEVNPLTERIADIDAGLAAAGAGAARSERDRRLAAHLERIRTGEAGFGRKRSVPLAFAEHGLDVLNDDPETVAAAIRDSWIARDLVTALENWANASGAYDMTPSPAGLHVLDVLAVADPDPLRQAIREAARTHDIDRLRSLVTDDSSALFEESTPSRLAIHLMRGDDTDAARTLLEEALRRKPDRFWVSIQLAFSLLQHEPKRPAEAEGYLRAALALQPKSVLARRWLGHALAAQGREAEAAEMWLDGVRDDPAHYLAFEPAVVQRLGGDDRMETVARTIEAEAERSPDDARVVFRLGGVREIQGQWPAAAAAYARAVAESPEEPRYRMRLAVAALHTGNWQRAHEQYVAMRDLAPGEPAFHVLFGDALQQHGEFRAALDAYDAAFRLQPGRPGLTWTRGQLQYRLGRVEEAIKAFELVGQRAPNFVPGAFRLGFARQRTGDLAGAARAYERALRFDPTHAPTLLHLGYLYLGAGREDEGEEKLLAYYDHAPWSDTWALAPAAYRRDVDALVDLARRHPPTAGMELPEVDPRRMALFAHLALELSCYELASRAFAAAFRLDPDVPDAFGPFAVPCRNRARAAFAAGLVASGRGAEAHLVEPRQRRAWRAQARVWLEQEGAAWADVLARGDLDLARLGTHVLLQELDAAPVREVDRIRELPEEQQAAWSRVWSEIRQLAAQAEADLR